MGTLATLVAEKSNDVVPIKNIMKSPQIHLLDIYLKEMKSDVRDICIPTFIAASIVTKCEIILRLLPGMNGQKNMVYVSSGI
jgi:hypothetical protein